MEIALFLFLIPIAWMVFAKIFFQHAYTWKEAGIQFGICTLSTILLTGLTYAALHSKAFDTELHNGMVTDKYNQRTSCSHSYQCNPKTVTDSNGNTRIEYETCYEHSFDIDWIVDTTVGSMGISRVNRQGTIEPPRFTDVEIGEPATVERMYQNFVKANPDSIFNVSEFTELVEQYNEVLPNYPDVHDYYRVNRVLVVGETLPRDMYRDLNESISMELRTLSAEKEVNVVVVATDQPSMDYAYALEYKWLGGKKNDVVVVMSLDESNTIQWIHSFGWSSTNQVYVNIEDSFTGENFTVDGFTDDLTSIIRTSYNRQSFDEYQYLLDELSPPLWSIIIAFLLNIVVAVGLGIFFIKNET